ncbi:MAG TPA: HGGxSTG domain-containing protein [Solirubrobacterales bacterium]|nr:HGGxSTG domain-containing protein [Solirubrobacterales bacterium]
MSEARAICGAKTRAGGKCGRQPMSGYHRCDMHGGKLPQVRRMLARQEVEAKAMRVIEREGIAPVGDPVELLRALAAEAIGLKNFFAARMAALEDIRYATPGAGEQLRAEVSAYERGLDRAERFLADLARLGLDERRVRVTEAQATMLLGVIVRGLAAAGLAEEQQLQARNAIGAELRLIEAAS